MDKIIVTGCNGQLGRAINKELGATGKFEIVNTDVFEGEQMLILC
jgi:dTDP-4-dehydrorhamnose reductase